MRAKKGMILILILTVSIILFIYLYNSKNEIRIEKTDPITKQKTIQQENPPKDNYANGGKLSLLSSQKIFELGMKADEYTAVKIELNEALDEAKIAKIYENSVKFNRNTNTFSFKINVDGKKNEDYTVEVIRIRYNILKVIVLKNKSSIYENNKVKVDKRL